MRSLSLVFLGIPLRHHFLCDLTVEPPNARTQLVCGVRGAEKLQLYLERSQSFARALNAHDAVTMPCDIDSDESLC